MRRKYRKILGIILGAQREYSAFEGVSMSDYIYVKDRLEECLWYRKTWNRLTYFPMSERLMVSSPSALHGSVMGTIMGHLTSVLETIPVPMDTVIYRTFSANSVIVESVRAIPDLTVKMCTRGGRVGKSIWLMESAFSQSDSDAMRKLNAYVQDIPSLMVVGKLLIKQGQQYHSPGSKGSAALRLRSSNLMTQEEWTSGHDADEFEQVVVDGHTWLMLSSVEIHVRMRQAGNSKIELNDTDGNGYAFGTLFPTVNLGDINNAFQRCFELVKQEVFVELESINADRALFDRTAAWSPPCPMESASLRSALVYGAWAMAYDRYAHWRTTFQKKPYNMTSRRISTSHSGNRG